MYAGSAGGAVLPPPSTAVFTTPRGEMRSRRHHVKSRHGCLQCKARRTKCDELRPTCSKCQARGSPCSFRTDDNTLIFIDGPSVRKAKAAYRAGSNSPTEAKSSQSQLGTGSAGSAAGLQSVTSYARPSESAQPLSASSTSSHGGGVGSGTEPSPASLHGIKSPPLPLESPRSAGPGATFTLDEIEDLRLMRYFHTKAWEDFTQVGDNIDSKELRYLWREIVPDLALDHPFLLHALLSVSAIHAAVPSKESKPPTRDPASASSIIALFAPKPFDPDAMITRAEHHHALAMRLMGPALDRISAENMPALFLTSCLLAQYAFARSCVVKPRPETLPELCHVLTLMRGTGTIVRAGVSHLKSTPVRPWLLPMPKRPDAPLGPESSTYIARLRQLHAARFPGFVPKDLSGFHPFNAIANGPDDGATPENDARAYDACIRHLSHGFMLAREQPGSALISVPWAVSVPVTVLRGIKAHEPLALGLASGYALMLHGLNPQIWVQDWGRRVVDACEDALATSLLHGEQVELDLLAWPRRVVRDERPVKEILAEL